MILRMYTTLMPIILAGIMNMIFTKTKWYKNNKAPMDKGKLLKDGKRVLGDNKTWIGFFGMTVFTMIAQIFWGIICKETSLFIGKNDLYINNPNSLQFNLWIGMLFGLAYVICELPNSFIKRRLDIKPGKTDQSFKGGLFFIIDQIDSLIGITLILMSFSPMTLSGFFLYLLLGAMTHIIVNASLYKLHIRKNL